MQPQILVVSDPPHGNVDAEVVAEILGLEVDDALLKIAFPAPEILSASGPDRAREVARSLEDTGLSVVVIDGFRLANVPWAKPASTLDFEAGALVGAVHGQTIEIDYEAPLLGVYFRPPAEPSRDAGATLGVALRAGGGPAIAEALEWAPHLDLYFGRSGGLERIVIVEDVAEVLEECERRFGRIDVDRRLEGVRPRQRFVAGEAGFDMDLRKAFSFGTLLLRQILESISPDLRDVPQFEFASRLSCVMRRTSGVE